MTVLDIVRVRLCYVFFTPIIVRILCAWRRLRVVHISLPEMVYTNHVTTSAEINDSPGTVPVAVWTRSFNLTGRERFAAGRFLARVDANRTLAPGTLESGSRPEQVWTRP